MKANTYWSNLPPSHPVWNVSRFYQTVRGSRRLKRCQEKFASYPDAVDLFEQYLEHRDEQFQIAMSLLRTEKEAIEYCNSLGVQSNKRRTKSADHHQSSTATASAVAAIAAARCEPYSVPFIIDPQRRCLWHAGGKISVSARNLDGALPGTTNPIAVWEVKEYWGKTSGGSKMSDAVYQCELVGGEINEFNEQTGSSVSHIAILDGRGQWGHRQSDLRRFIDLLHRGLLTDLILGKEVELIWGDIVERNAIRSKTNGKPTEAESRQTLLALAAKKVDEAHGLIQAVRNA